MLFELDAAGVKAAFVDADQLRLASGIPAVETDLIGSALPALSRGYQKHGAQVLIVAGLAGDLNHLTRLLPGVPRDRVLTVHLDADGDTIRERVHHRGWLVELADDAVAYAAQIDPDLADLRVDTTGQTPGDLAAQVAEAAVGHVERTPSEGSDAPAANDETSAPRRVVVLTGPGGVGASTTGYQTFAQLAQTGEPVGYLDAHQFGLVGTETRSDRHASLRADNVRAAAGSLTRAGTRTLVVSGDARTTQLLPSSWGKETVIMKFWLHATEHTLADRITARSRGGGPPIQGDHRLGLSGPALQASIATAAAESERHDLRPVDAEVLDTTDFTPAQVAQTIINSLPEAARHTVVR
ncbi:hypothetical protein QFE97_00270 [Bacillus subtilis]|nr:hypothetical protein QFE97_00270 [Bacillus subtilis]